MNDIISWHTEKRKCNELVPCSYNPHKMSGKGKTDLTKSIKMFNLAEIPVINLDNQILAGHMRIAILKELGRGDELIDVRVPNRKLSKKEADEYLVRSNKNTGEWDIDILRKMFNFDFLKEAGFTDFELDKIFERFLKEEEEEFNGEKEYENIKEPQTKKCDVYALGNHRLMCGSCAEEKDFEKLMDGEKANLIFTDPPYNVNYKSPAGLSYESKKFGGTGEKVFDDNLSSTDCLAFYSDIHDDH